MSIPYHAFVDHTMAGGSGGSATRSFLLAPLTRFAEWLSSALHHAATSIAHPLESDAERVSRHHLDDVSMVNHMADEMDAIEPDLAHELRCLAARD